MHIRVDPHPYPLLRRAFSLHGADPQRGTFDILFKVVGTGTSVLSEKNPGEALDLLGPLGNSFSIPKKTKEFVLVAGGMGIAPLYFLARKLAQRRNKVTFFYGSKTEDEILLSREFQSLNISLKIATDDGTWGFKGLVTEFFEKGIKRGNLKNSVVYSCGPEPMLKKMTELSRKYKFFCQISLETHMPCGVGSCMGCVVKCRTSRNRIAYKRACKDGPVFDAQEVIFD